MKTFHFHPANFTESPAVLKNPCCGWYRVLCYTPEESADVHGWIAEFLDPQADSLLLLEINLKNYAGKGTGQEVTTQKSHAIQSMSKAPTGCEAHAGQGLSPAALKQIDTIFSAAEKNHTDLIVRFLYDTDGTPDRTEPKNINQVREHIGQLAEIVNTHASCIFLLQGCLTGAYGEMHGGRFAAPAVQKELVTFLADRIDSSIFLAVRTPLLQCLCTGSPLSVTRENAFDGSLSARLGLFNDGLFGSETDLGTYGTASSVVVPPADMIPEDHWKIAGNREAELAFQKKLCTYVPNGGEAVGNASFSKYPACIRDLQEMHISYLNTDYDPATIASWRKENCSDTEQLAGSSVFKGSSVFDYVGAHLGYRYIVTQAKTELSSSIEAIQGDSTEAQIATSGKASPDQISWCNILFRFTLENRGFAPAYRRFETRLSLVREGTTLSYLIPFDNRFLTGNGGKAELTCSIPLRELPACPCEVRLEMTDPVSGKDIQFANEPAETSVFLGILNQEQKNASNGA